MENKMFCFQCEQTAKGTGCTIKGVCGKESDTANLQDELISTTIKFANCAKENDENTDLIIKALFTSITNVSFDNTSIYSLTSKIKHKIPCDFEFDIKEVWGDDDLRSLKSIILFGLKGIAAYAYHAKVLGYRDKCVDNFFYEALKKISSNCSCEEYFEFVLKTGEINLKCMELLDRANTESYGNPEPTEVSTYVDCGPFIVVSGHDLRDLKLLLEQTKDKGINIYTHGEMLPAHAYPELKKYSHLRGNFGTAWQNQQKEFENIPAPILFTTNCIMPVKESYSDRVYTTSVVQYPNMIHIDENKDFTPLIEKSLELGGYSEFKEFTGINGGHRLRVGFGHDTVLAISDKIIESIKSGDINHIFLVGGCDGAKTGRNYYTEFVKRTPNNTLVLTLACGKYRFNDLDLGDINGIPRILDMGQCNDAYSAIKVVLELANAIGYKVNDLPLSIVLSWYEQKAISILLTLLYLGIERIKLGPTLPAFISPNVLQRLVEKYKIAPIKNPKDDIKELLG